MKICPNCSAENDDNEKVCYLCECDLDEVVAVPSIDNATVSDADKSHVIPSDRISDVIPDKKTDKPENSDQSGSKKKIIAVIVFIIAVLVCGGVVLLMKDKGNDNNKVPDDSSGTSSDDTVSETISSTEENTTVADEDTVATDATEKDADENSTESKTEKPTEKAEDKSWQNLYAKQLKDFKSSDDYNGEDGMASTYDLFDIDGDKIPELFISTGEFHSSECRVYSVIDSKCVNIFKDDMAYGVIKVVPEKNYFVHYNSHTGYNNLIVTEYNNGTTKAIDNLSDNIANVSFETLKCTRNGQEIDADDYVSVYNKYAGLDSYSLGKQFDFSDISADSLVKNYKDSKPSQNPVTTKIEVPEPATEEPLPSISAYIETYSAMQGYSSYLFVTGDFAYVKVAECYQSSKSEYRTYYKSEFSPSVYLLGYSAFGPDRPYIEIIPYNSSNKAGNTITCQLPDDPAHSVPISDKLGLINVHGGAVSGVDASYVLNNQPYATVRDRLGDGWHIVAKNTCSNHGVTWYECWDSQDGDYYGWVDSSFIDFY